MKRSPPKRKSKPRRRPDDTERAGVWLRAVIGTAPVVHKRRICPVCREKPRGRLQGHHVIKQQKLQSYAREVARAMRMDKAETEALFARLRWDIRNGLPVCDSCHVLHTRAVRLIPYRLLRPCHFEFAAELGLTWYLERHYPRDDDQQGGRAAGVGAPAR